MPPIPVADWQMIGSLADWSTTLVALLAFLVASIAARATIQTNRAQQETLELQRRQFEDSKAKTLRKQAEQVVFWHDPDRSAVCIVNASELPIYGVEITLPIQNETTTIRRQVLLPTGTEGLSVQLPSEEGLEDSIYETELHLHFFDAAGNCWARSIYGDLMADTEILSSWGWREVDRPVQ